MSSDLNMEIITVIAHLGVSLQEALCEAAALPTTNSFKLCSIQTEKFARVARQQLLL